MNPAVANLRIANTVNAGVQNYNQFNNTNFTDTHQAENQEDHSSRKRKDSKSSTSMLNCRICLSAESDLSDDNGLISP